MAKAMNVKMMTELVMKSQAVGDKAGDRWMEKATAHGPKYIVDGNPEWTMLDLCGNAHVQVKDGRSRFSKFLKGLDEHNRYNVTVLKSRKYIGRQEYGLAQAIARAQMEYLVAHGITGLRIWEYVD